MKTAARDARPATQEEHCRMRMDQVLEQSGYGRLVLNPGSMWILTQRNALLIGSRNRNARQEITGEDT